MAGEQVIDSILQSIKKLLGIEEDYTQFDADIIVYINATFMTLHQLGIGPTVCFSIATDQAEWSDFFGSRPDLELVKSYMYLRVRLLFDPPQTGYLVESYNKQITEYEWRLQVQGEA